MASPRSERKPLSLYLVLALGLAAAASIAAGFWVDRGTRSRGPEAPVIAYAAAVERRDLGAALEQLSPQIRDRSASFVDTQLGNRYTILESAVQGSSLLDSLLGRPDSNTRVVVTMDVQETESGTAPWRTTQDLPVGMVDGRWYLLKPPLQP